MAWSSSFRSTFGSCSGIFGLLAIVSSFVLSAACGGDGAVVEARAAVRALALECQFYLAVALVCCLVGAASVV
jgi:hypothetical protein